MIGKNISSISTIPATKVLLYKFFTSNSNLPKHVYQLSATNEPIGIIHKSRPIFGTQFHPEARGGPLDSSYLFDTYLDSVQKYKSDQAQFQPARNSKPSQMLVDLLAKDRVGVAPTIGMANMANMARADAAAAAA